MPRLTYYEVKSIDWNDVSKKNVIVVRICYSHSNKEIIITMMVVRVVIPLVHHRWWGMMLDVMKYDCYGMKYKLYNIS